MKKIFISLLAAFCLSITFAHAETGTFDINRWYGILNRIQNAALEQHISAKTINSVIQESVVIPDIIYKDKNQPELKKTLAEYIAGAMNPIRINQGKTEGKKYTTLLARTEQKYGVPRNVLLAFWGMESGFGTSKGQFVLTDAFLTLIYEGRREQFFTNQLLAIMRQADRNKADIKSIRGSWAGAMGHFQFIPTTLEQYGIDGNNDGKIDINNSIGDALASAGNYLKKMGWEHGDNIVQTVSLPPNFDPALCDGRTKLKLDEWRAMGIIDVPVADRVAGLVCDVSTYPTAYLTYDNFYRILRWNNSSAYAIAIALLADELK